MINLHNFFITPITSVASEITMLRICHTLFKRLKKISVLQKLNIDYRYILEHNFDLTDQK